MLNAFQESLRALREFFQGIGQAFKKTSTDKLEFELRELENMFGVLVLGSFIGIPSPPSGISLRLLPHMSREILIMSERTRDLDDIFGEIAGLMDI
ncbi:hypothetical protein CSB45_06940 [candidate division KSB3 bacterium]|uniref:Uncharacterized protein n=1 Tax=candidate division KSB3 bacterium TaxID=2044937 RepID=A0A2G6E704_9BACT|nr:MAG: hypothetical protein CSB45_06940 [candidate division KSB3 bacterium]PIE30106.1 MAG: hypothetical protein CSA57_05655 [candidate division KSB3 bacterium]